MPVQTRDDFEGWLQFIDDTIAQLRDEHLPADVAARLDRSLGSLSVLERWLLDTYDSPRAILKPDENWVLDRVAKYVGETIRRHAGGEWDINLDDPTMAYYRLPVLANGDKWTDCPATLVTASLDRRRGNFIETVARNLAAC